MHHGNGTQEIVEALMKPKQFTVSNDCSPFSTFEISMNRYQPWLDFKDGKNVLFVSVQAKERLLMSADWQKDGTFKTMKERLCST